MNTSVRKLIERVQNDSPTVRNESARTLALWLEIRTLKKADVDSCGQLLPPDLLENPPTSADERDVVLALGAVARSPNRTPTVVWALGKASSVEALEHILAALCAASCDEEFVWQALIATDNWLQRALAELDPNVLDLTTKCGVRSALNELSEKSSERVRALAGQILRRVFS